MHQISAARIAGAIYSMTFLSLLVLKGTSLFSHVCIFKESMKHVWGMITLWGNTYPIYLLRCLYEDSVLENPCCSGGFLMSQHSSPKGMTFGRPEGSQLPVRYIFSCMPSEQGHWFPLGRSPRHPDSFKNLTEKWHHSFLEHTISTVKGIEGYFPCICHVIAEITAGMTLQSRNQGWVVAGMI